MSHAVQIVKDSPMQVGYLVSQVRPPRPSLTVIVKATYAITEGVASLARRQRHLSGELFFDDDETQSVRTDSDLAVLKPAGECFLAGHCCAPGARPAATVACGFSVGAVERTFVVHGDRFWNKGIFANTHSKPESFTKMPLRWERAFGGPSIAANPVGSGMVPSIRAHGETPGEARIALPNVESPTERVASPASRPRPQCAAPLPRGWAERTRHQGTYDAAYQRKVFPYFPEDFSWEYFNAAPPEQRIERYWRGDEEVSLRHLHPTHTAVRTKLPGLRPRACLLVTREGRAVFEEVRLSLDTITVDADAWEIYCVFRGLAEVDDEQARTVSSLYLTHDEPGATRSLAALRKSFDVAVRAADERDPGFAIELPPEGDERPVDDGASGGQAATEAARDAVTRQAVAREEARLDAQLEEVEQRLAEAKFAPPGPVLAAEELVRIAAESGIAIDDDVLALLREMGAAAPSSEAPEREPSAEGAGEPSLRDDVCARFARGESLAGQDFTAADLSKLDLSGADFSGAVLAGVNFTEAKLVGARFDAAVLSGAVLAKADLTKASLAKADLAAADATGARLVEANLAGATGVAMVLSGAVLDRCVAKGADLTRSNLAGASAKRVDFTAVDLAGAMLERADFTEATLVDASITGAKGPRIVMTRAVLTRVRAGERADFTDGRFHAVEAKHSVWSEDLLAGADFAFSELEGADFGGAVLHRASFDGCGLRQARFDEAQLQRATMRRADLLEAKLTGANAQELDARGSSFFAVDFFRAVTDGARFELADLTRTALEPRE